MNEIQGNQDKNTGFTTRSKSCFKSSKNFPENDEFAFPLSI